MLAATETTHRWPEGSPEGSPFLASAPEGLSARRVEHWLDLPVGAWQRRRLYALRLKSDAYSSLHLRAGDLVVVEPGAKEQPGGIVVTRSAKGPSLRRVLGPSSRQAMPTVLELPLRERSLPVREHVVGSVIGLLRPTHTGALRPVPLASARTIAQRGNRRLAGAESSPASLGLSGGGGRTEKLREELEEWRKWREQAGASSPTPASTHQMDRWDRLEASLSTLCDCLARAHSPRLLAALSEEAGHLLGQLQADSHR